MKPESSSDSISVLIVDDQYMYRKYLGEELRDKWNMVVKELATAEEALSVLKEGDTEFNVIVVDEILGEGMDGVEATSRIKTIAPQMKVILVSSRERGRAEYIKEIYTKGADFYFKKDDVRDESLGSLISFLHTVQLQQRLAADGKLISGTRAIAENLLAMPRHSLLKEIVILGQQLLEASATLIWVRDKTTNHFVPEAMAGFEFDDPDSIGQLDISKDELQRYSKNNEPVLYNDITNLGNLNGRSFLRRCNFRGLMTMPMLIGGQVIGFIDIYYNTTKDFALWQKELLAAFSAHAAISIRQSDVLDYFQQLNRYTDDHKQLSNFVVNSLHNLTGQPIVLWRPESITKDKIQVYRAVAARGLKYGEQDYVGSAIVPTTFGLSITSVALYQKRAIYYSDIFDARQEVHFYNKSKAIEEEWVSVLILPLFMSGGEAIGSISIYSNKDDLFNPSDVERDVLQTIANHTAAAFANVDLLESARTRQRALEKIVDAGKAINNEMMIGLPAVLVKIAESARQVFSAASSVIYTYNYDGKFYNYDIENTVSSGLQNLKNLKKRSRKFGLAAAIREMGELVVEDVDIALNNAVVTEQEAVDETNLEALILDEKFIKHEHVKSFVALSLQNWSQDKEKPIAHRSLGILFLNFSEPRHFTKESLSVMRIFSQQATVAIQTASLFTHERTLRQNYETLNTIAEAISSDLTPETVVQKILRQLRILVDYKKASIQIIKGDMRNLLASDGYDTGKYDEYLLRPISKDKLISQIVKKMRPLILSNTSKSVYWEQTPQTSWIRSWVGLPLIFRNEVIGLLLLDHDEPGYFNREIQDKLMAFASHVAIAIHNAKVYQEMEEQLRITTERVRRAEESIMINTFAADVLHKIPNLIGTIPIRVESMIKELNLNKKNNDSIMKQLLGIANDSSLLIDLLQEWNPSDPLQDITQVDIPKLLDSVVSNIHFSDEIKLIRRYKSSIPRVQCNPKEAYEAFLHLIENGIQAIRETTERKGTLSLKIDSQLNVDGQDWVSIEISDTGIGISEDLMDRVFGLFFTTKQNHFGFGYGLWRSRGIIESLGGRISLNSKKLRGTTVMVLLPTISKGR